MPELLTTDVSDDHGDAVYVSVLPLISYGGRARFSGPAATVSCHEDNVVLRGVLEEPGDGRVLVVDGGGSRHRAVIGDQIAGLAVEQGWAGVVVHGVVRDAAELARLPLGVVALGTSPRRSGKTGAGNRDVILGFGGVMVHPGDLVVVDEDGLVVVPAGATDVAPDRES